MWCGGYDKSRDQKVKEFVKNWRKFCTFFFHLEINIVCFLWYLLIVFFNILEISDSIPEDMRKSK